MRSRERLALWGYVGLTNLLLPVGILVGFPILLLREKRRKTLFRRLGFQKFPKANSSPGPLWVHALSLGETLSCVALVEALRSRITDRPIYFSVSTLAAMDIATERVRPFVDGLFYFPLDLWWPARRALKRIAPCLMVFVETDIWPGFQLQLRQAGIPSILVNGRLSPGSYRACHRFRSLFGPALNTFHQIHPQSKSEGQRYLQVGVEPHKLCHAGNLKFDVANRNPGAEQLSSIRDRLGLDAGAPVVLAGSTHPGEEEQVMEAYARVLQGKPNVRMIVVPRHPARADDVVALMKRNGWMVQTFKECNTATRWDVLVVDVMGVLSMLYHLATVSFVGGSLVSKGGQNPLEPAAAGCPVMFGPDMSDFPDIAEWLMQGGGARRVSTGTDLGDRWLELLIDEGRHGRMSDACRRVMKEHQGATTRIADEIVARVTGSRTGMDRVPDPY